MNENLVPGFDRESCRGLSLRLEQVEGEPSFLYVSVSGRLDHENRGAFERRLLLAAEAGYSSMVLDLARVAAISASLVGAFEALRRALEGRGGGLVLAGLRPPLAEVLDRLGAAGRFERRPDLAAALQRLREPRAARPGEPRTLYPLLFGCPSCGKKIMAPRAGVFRCSSCRELVSVDDEANITRA